MEFRGPEITPDFIHSFIHLSNHSAFTEHLLGPGTPTSAGDEGRN